MGHTLFNWPGGVIPVPGDNPGRPNFIHTPEFVLESGRITVIAGEPGVGKSFFLSALVGLTDPGMIHPKFHGISRSRALRDFEPALQRFIYVAQFPAVRRELKTRRECILSWERLLEGLDEEERSALLGVNQDLDRRYDFLAQGLQLWDERKLDKRIGELSGGQLKRFGLLLRLPFYAPILVLDEPDTGLDQTGAESVIHFIRSSEYQAEFGRPPAAILMVTHNKKLQDLADPPLIELKRLAAAPPAEFDAYNQSGIGEAAEISAEKRENARNPMRTLEGAVDSAAHRAFHECRHHLTIFLRSFQDFSVLLLSPLLIFLLLRICEQLYSIHGIPASNGTDINLQNRFAKYAFFAVIASAWLGIQLYGKIPVTDAIVMKEEFFWIAHLRGGWRQVIRSHICGVTLGLIFTVAASSLFQTFIGAAIFFWQPFGWGGQNPEAFALIFIPLFCSYCYGGMLGLALGATLAWWQLDVWRPRRRPSLTWLNLLVPVIMLFHILFSHVYVSGGSSDEIESIGGIEGRIATINVCARLCGWLENGFSAANKGHLAEKFRASLSEGSIPLLVCWLVFFTAVFAFCFYRILQTPEVRRE